jgi:hypothetical protein
VWCWGWEVSSARKERWAGVYGVVNTWLTAKTSDGDDSHVDPSIFMSH